MHQFLLLQTFASLFHTQYKFGQNPQQNHCNIIFDQILANCSLFSTLSGIHQHHPCNFESLPSMLYKRTYGSMITPSIVNFCISSWNSSVFHQECHLSLILEHQITPKFVVLIHQISNICNAVHPMTTKTMSKIDQNRVDSKEREQKRQIPEPSKVLQPNQIHRRSNRH